MPFILIIWYTYERNKSVSPVVVMESFTRKQSVAAVHTSAQCVRNETLIYTIHIMVGVLLKFFAAFWVIWILWYLTGGPLRDDKTKPYVGFNEAGQLTPLGTSTPRYSATSSFPQ